MTPLEMIAEWRKGCTCAGPTAVTHGLAPEGTGPEDCPECTVGLIDHLEAALRSEAQSA